MLVLCLTWELLVGSQRVSCMAVFVLANFFNTEAYCLSEVSYNNICTKKYAPIYYIYHSI